ncbi:MAG TPA: tRNA pseudouridine(55) synthase TruB, partial [Thermoanaerobaculia bacterium]|nr:tRNA pseudouridine(55) synthase TruB [Thermoanaerobaculia bacterium]
MKDGLLLIDKEPGLTSHDVVQRVRRLLGQKKIGHCGTLDPDATGLLLLTLGTATRLTRFLIRAPKVYHGVIRFGVVTDTYDASGKVLSEAPAAAVAALGREQVVRAMHGFVGAIEQQAPPYSAKKVHGVKLYELARRGEEVPAEAKEGTIYEFEPAGELADGCLSFRLSCSSGTYARALANDLGSLMGVGAHLT